MNAQATERPSMNEETYLKERVDNQLKFYENSATKAKSAYTCMQRNIIVLGVLVPVFINLPYEWIGITDMPVKILVTIMSVTLAILNGLLNFGKHQDLWLSYRLTEELLKQEKFLFLTGAEPYQERDSAFSRFVPKIESILSAEHNKFRSLIEDSKRPTKHPTNPQVAT